MKKYVLVVLVIIFAAGLVWFGTLDQEAQDGLLEPEQQVQTEQTQAPAETAALQVQGVYEGVLPAADCPGIQTTLTLYTNGTFQLNEVYLERDTAFTQTGSFTMADTLLTLLPQEDSPRYLRLGAGTATFLNADGQPYSGELADHYVLKQK